MTNSRAFSWSTALRDVRSERAPRAGIREERLRSTAGLAEAGLADARRMTSWRGASGRRYVVGVHATGAPEIDEMTDAVVLAVRRGRDGSADLLDVATAEPAPPGGRASAGSR